MKSQYRFFLPSDSIHEDRVRFPEAVSRQLKHVLRLRPGAAVTILDNSGDEFLVELDAIDPRASGRIVSRRQNLAEPALSVHLLMGVVKGKKLELIWQKATELGVAHLTPVQTRFAVSEPPSWSRAERLADIVREAAEQSGRGRLPTLHEAVTFDQAIEMPAAAKFILSATSTDSPSLPEAIPAGISDCALLIGPEGGFATEELDAAEANGFRPISLGPRTLRAETAAIAAMSLVLLSGR